MEGLPGSAIVGLPLTLRRAVVMLKTLVISGLLAALPAASLVAQSAKAAKQTSHSAIVEPQSISGLASSGRNCIGPSGSNVHPIGWVPNNSRVAITFSSDFDPVAS